MPKDLDDLRERKKELLLESDINRQIVSLEVSQIKIKAVEWRRGLMKAGTIYKWVAPLAGVGLGLFAARKQVAKAKPRASHHNGNGHGKAFSYASLVGPLGATVLKQALNFWRHARDRKAYGSAE
jgi:hypothetical protein